MSISYESNSFQPMRAASFFKWVSLLVLLFIELMVLTIRFDSASIDNAGGFIQTILERVPLIPQYVAVVASATLIFGGSQFWGSVKLLQDLSEQQKRWQLWLVLQVASFIVLFFVTEYLFEIDRGSTSVALFVWLGSVSVCFTTFAAMVISPLRWALILRAFALPISVGLLVGFLAWYFATLSIGMWHGLAFLTFFCVYAILSTVGIPVLMEPSNFEIGSPIFSVQIAPACSGYEGMGLAFVFIGTYLWWRREEHRFPISILLLPASIVCMFAANALRIAILILLGHCGLQQFALGAFHSQAGWIGFNLVALAIVGYARTSPIWSKRAGELVKAEMISVPFLAPFLLLTLAIMGTTSDSTTFDWLYPVRFLVVAFVVAVYWKTYASIFGSPTFSWLPFGIGAGVFILWMYLEEPSSPNVHNMYETMREQSPAFFSIWVIFRVLGSVVTVPLAEELAFRGYLIPWLSSEVPGASRVSWSWLAMLLSSLAFGILHPGHFFAGTCAGLVYAFAYFHRGKLFDAVVAHATTNALIALNVLLSSRWSLWG